MCASITPFKTTKNANVFFDYVQDSFPCHLRRATTHRTRESAGNKNSIGPGPSVNLFIGHLKINKNVHGQFSLFFTRFQKV